MPGSQELKMKLKSSDVKLLYESELLEVQGTDEVEKVTILDHDEEEKYDLYVDAVVILDQE